MLGMFREAIDIARHYTAPVILSEMAVNGECASGVGAFVIINDDGWFVSANHIMEDLSKGIEAARDTKQRLANGEDVSPTDIIECSSWWSFDSLKIKDAYGYRGLDLVVGRLEPFHPSWVRLYPVFKKVEERDFKPGTSLCKIGYPFNEMITTWNDGKKGFDIDESRLPTLFPLDGIYTRTIDLHSRSGEPSEIPYKWVETSTPGLRGQSGGPIFDNKGVVWGIQCQTQIYDLDFDMEVTEKKSGEKMIIPQFWNVGCGVHPESLFAAFDKLDIKYNVSAY